MKVKAIISILNQLAPTFLIDSWDNSGLQIGSLNTETEKILISLDLSRKALDIALKENVDMIVTHHPFIFGKMSSIYLDDEKGMMVRDIIKNDMTVFSMHTNLDICEGGVNDVLCEKLGIKVERQLSKFIVENLEVNLNDKSKTYGYGRVGELKEKTTLLEFSNLVSERLKCNDLRVYGNLDKTIKKVAVCGGSGASFIDDAYRAEVDVYVTGDIKYHDAQLAKELGLTLIDAGHFETEAMAIEVLEDYISRNTKDVEILVFKESVALFSTLK